MRVLDPLGSTLKHYRQLFGLLTKRGRKQIGLLFVMMIFGAIFEAIGIGLVMPFIAVVSTPDQAMDYAVLRIASDLLGPLSTRSLLIFCGLLLLSIFILKNAYLSLTYYLQYRIVFGQQVALARRLYSAYLRNPYSYHLRRNSSELLRNLSDQIRRAFVFSMIPSLTIMVEGLVVLVVAILLVAVEPIVAPISVLGLGVVAGLFFLVIRRKILIAGRRLMNSSAELIKWVHQGLGGLKEAKVLGREEYFLDQYSVSSDRYARAMRTSVFLQSLPRHVIETVAIGGLLLVLTLVLVRGDDAKQVVPIVGLFAMAAVRLMPSLTRIISAMTQVRHNMPAVQNILQDLAEAEALAAQANEHLQNGPEIGLRDELRLDAVGFRFEGATRATISKLSLAIKRGETVAFVGPSGAGKSTTVDIVMGLLRPDEGDVLVDGRSIFDNLPSWRRQVGYIPQPIYLCDASLRENVAFGIERDAIDEDQVWSAIRMAQIEGLVEELSEGLDTEIGEQGVRISGGQRQRIGIARALYHDPEVLVFDEATSALDAKTEAEINRAIARFSGQKTVIIISHRLETVRGCDRLFLLEEGCLIEAATYEELMANSPRFRELAQAANRAEGPL